MPRKKPFSGVQKKKQLQEKKARQRGETPTTDTRSAAVIKKYKAREKQQKKENFDGTPTDGLRTVFGKESKEEIEARKKLAMEPIVKNNTKFNDLSYFGDSLEIPSRPTWDYSLSKEQLEAREEKYFKSYLESVYNTYAPERLNYFEHNLNVWRQFWRTCESSDILCVLADIRHPLFHFPPSLYRYLHNVIKKPIILVLTKADLVSQETVNKWIQFFKTNFPTVQVALVNPFKKYKVDLKSQLGKKKKMKIKSSERYNGSWKALIDILNVFVLSRGGEPIISTEISTKEDKESSEDDTSSDEDERKNINGEGSSSEEENSNIIIPEEKSEDTIEETDSNVDDNELDYHTNRSDKKYVTIGFIGSPNVGKSSLINAIRGKKMCSESRTPGHTKHRQTLYLNPKVVLSDCPGLVFPVVDVPRQLQIISGIFPVAQVREPYSTIQYLGAYIDFPEIYKLTKDTDGPWSAYDICDSLATKRGFLTKAGRAFSHRAGLEILFDIIDGKIPWHFDPKDLDVNRVYSTNNQNHKLLITKDNQETTEETTPSIISANSINQTTPTIQTQSSEIKNNSTISTNNNNNNKKTRNIKKFSSSSDEDSSEEQNFKSTNPFSLLNK